MTAMVGSPAQDGGCTYPTISHEPDTSQSEEKKTEEFNQQGPQSNASGLQRNDSDGQRPEAVEVPHCPTRHQHEDTFDMEG